MQQIYLEQFLQILGLLTLSHNSYSLDIAPRIQQYYEDYYEVKYPLPKQDLVVSDNCDSFKKR